MQRGGSILPRYAYYRQRLAHLPRAWRRRLGRKVASGLGGAALLLALAGPLTLAQPEQPAAADAVITVINGQVGVASNGQCSLVEAIQNANSVTTGRPYPDCAAGNPNGADTINLPANGVFTLTSAFLPDAQVGPIGLPWISSTTTINGNGSTIQRQSNAAEFRIMAVGKRGNLALNGVTIRGGSLPISEFEDAYYVYSGGGILNQGQLTISGSIITENVAASYWYGGDGGGISNFGTLTITDSTVTDNGASGLTGGYGGGISSRGSLTVVNTTVTGNDVWGRYSYGGGIYSEGTMTLRDSYVADNEAWAEYNRNGGGVAARGNSSIQSSTITRNRAGSGAASTYTAYVHSGAIFNSGLMTITNSTITGNENFDEGAAIANFKDLTIVNSTITGNEGGVANVCYHSDSVTRLQRTIVSGNNRLEATIEPRGACETSFVANSHNVLGYNGNAHVIGFSPGPTDIVPAGGIDTILSPLADNGGPTLTHALPAGSPALDLAPNASSTAAPVNGVDQRGEPRNQNGKGGVTANECDAGAFERGGSVAQMGFYVSAGAAGAVGGVAFAPGDILKFTPAGGWSMFFDASDVGLTKNVVALEIEDNGDILLALAAAQTVPGVGNVQPQDVLRFTPSSTGDSTAGAFAMALDGSTKGLTTSGEKIDALGRTDGRIALSTSGAAAVKRPDNTALKAQDEDALGFNLASGQWSEYFNGTAIPGLAAEDINGLWIDPATGDLYISIVGGFNLAGVKGDGKDIVKLSPSGAPGGYTPSLFWDGSANGFPASIDGLEMIP